MAKEMIKIIHNNYEKISDDVMWFNTNWIMKFVVQLNRYNDKFGRMNYHKEVLYRKNGYDCINLNRSFDYFLLIESTFKNDNGLKENIILGTQNMYIFKYKLSCIEKWFTSKDYDNLFVKKDGRVILYNRVDPIIISNLPGDKYIEFEPDVFELDNGDQIIGANVYFGSNENKIFMSIDKFFELKYFIDNFNMFESAQLMINYLIKVNPGENLYDINNKYNNTYNSENNIGTKMVKSGNTKDGLSFFEKIK